MVVYGYVGCLAGYEREGGKVEEANSFIAKKIIIDRAAEIILCN